MLASWEKAILLSDDGLWFVRRFIEKQVKEICYSGTQSVSIMRYVRYISNRYKILIDPSTDFSYRKLTKKDITEINPEAVILEYRIINVSVESMKLLANTIAKNVYDKAPLILDTIIRLQHFDSSQWGE